MLKIQIKLKIFKKVLDESSKINGIKNKNTRNTKHGKTKKIKYFLIGVEYFLFFVLNSIYSLTKGSDKQWWNFGAV